VENINKGEKEKIKREKKGTGIKSGKY